MSKDQRNRKKSDRVEPELDFFSDDFNPLRALTTSQSLSVPERRAGFSQSVRKFESELKRERQRKKTEDLQTVRKFEEHQCKFFSMIYTDFKISVNLCSNFL